MCVRGGDNTVLCAPSNPLATSSGGKKELILPKSLFYLFFHFYITGTEVPMHCGSVYKKLVETGWRRENKNEKPQTTLEVVFCRQGRVRQLLEGV